jgi:hypothetical protein
MLKRKNTFIKNNMAGDDYFTGGDVIAAISTMLGRIAEEHTRRGARPKLVKGRGGDIGITEATKDPESVVWRRTTMETRERNRRTDGLTWSAIEKKRGRGQSFSPKRLGETGMKHKRAHRVIDGANRALSLAVLLRGIWTR